MLFMFTQKKGGKL